jgi:Raf kinase inhibitor-like YbhB/YbcL family protein
MEDIDASFVHWVVSNLPRSTHSLNSNELPKGAVTSQAGNGASGYVGPCPPTGKVHHYRITVYALKNHPHLNAASPTKTSLAAIQQAAITKGSLSVQAAR